MLSKIGTASRRAFSEKGSLIALEALNDGDDLFISPSFQPGEENSSVSGNISYVGHIEAPPLPYESDKNIYSETSDSTVSSTSIASTGTQPRSASRLSLQRLTSTIPKRDQISKIKEDVPWAIYGNDQVSRLANDTLESGDDIQISASCEQDDFSVVGNSSVAPIDAESIVAEMEEGDNHTPTSYSIKTKKGLFRKLALTKKITRILPSKQYVARLSRLAEDVPWSMNGQEQISREAGDILNDGDDLFITESFQPLEEDTSSVLGNMSYVSEAKSTLGAVDDEEIRDDLSTHETFMKDTRRAIGESKVGMTGILKTQVTEKLKNAIPAPITETFKSAIPVAEKLKSAIPSPVTQKLKDVSGNVVSSSQKLMPWRLKSMVSSQIRMGPISEYHEISDDNTDSAKELLLPSNYTYHTKAIRSGIKGKPRNRPVKISSRDRMEQNIVFSLSNDTESSRHRSLSWDNASYSDMSDITEPSIHSRTRSFRTARSMYILPAGESLLGSADEESEAGTEGNRSTTSNSNSRAVRRSMANLPNINESKPFNVMSSAEIVSPSVVNGFLNRMKSNDKHVDHKSEEPWDAVSIMSNEDWQHTSVSDIPESANRHRVFSDSDVVYEFQRQRSIQETDNDPNPDIGTLKGFIDDDSLTLFLDDDNETNDFPAFEKQQSIPSDSAGFPLYLKDEYDQWTSAKFSSDDFVDDHGDAWNPRAQLPSKNLGDDILDAAWDQRRGFVAKSNVLQRRKSTEHNIDVDDDFAWSPRPRFASDSEVINNNEKSKEVFQRGVDTDTKLLTWRPRPRFASDTLVVTDDSARKNVAGLDTEDVNHAAASIERAVDVEGREFSWELSTDSEATDDKPVEENSSSDDASIDNEEDPWHRRPLFNPDSSEATSDGAAYGSPEEVHAISDAQEHDSSSNPSWGNEPALPSDDLVSDDNSEDNKDDHAGATWSRYPLFNPDSSGEAYGSSEEILAVVDVEEQDYQTDASRRRKPKHGAFTSDTIVDENARAQRPRYLSYPEVSNADVTETNPPVTLKPVTDGFRNSRSRFFSDPLTTSQKTRNPTIGVVDNLSSAHRRRLSSNSLAAQESNTESTSSSDRDQNSPWDEKPRFSPASVAINDNADSSEIEISLHAETSRSLWRWTRTEAQSDDENDTEKVSSKVPAHDYYWNQSSESEEDAEEMLLPWGQNDSFDDIL